MAAATGAPGLGTGRLLDYFKNWLVSPNTSMLLRSLLFYLGYIASTILWGGFWTVFGLLLPFQLRFRVIINWWSRFVLLWLRITCGVRYSVDGLENLPEQPCVVLARHESTWETLFLQSLFVPQATVIKRSLLNIPFFGWPFRLLRPIPIDRDKPKQALRTIRDVGSRRLADGLWVVLFPEGTRCPVGEIGKFGPSGAFLCQSAKVPCLVVAHDAGRYWPPHRFAKRPGVVRVKIAPRIDTLHKNAKEINEIARDALVESYARLELSG